MKHGLTVGFPTKGKKGRYDPEYRAWQSMKDRCLNPRHRKFHLWGGRGIKVHEAWIHDPAAFIAHMGPKPSASHSLDRYPDKDGNYEPGNVRWATAAEQGRNTRSNKLTREAVERIREMLTAGETCADLAKIFGVSDVMIGYIKSGKEWW